jgi:transcription initiation factor IIE alpha subunit
MLVVCNGDNGCNKEFILDKLEVEYLDNEVEKSYFICPNCGKEFVAFYTDKAIRKKQNKVKKIKDVNKFNILKKSIAIDMKVLKEKIEQGNM